jgi:hypothetical protein
VIDDFVYNSMYAPAAPMIMYSDTSNVNFLTVRLKQNADTKAAVAKVEDIVKRNNPGYPVEFSFVDEQFDQLFKTETLIGKLAGVFAVLAIVISCLGLFGLSAYTAEKRTREIGIRKVLGASATGLAGLLSKDFIKLVLISCPFRISSRRLVYAQLAAGLRISRWAQLVDIHYRRFVSDGDRLGYRKLPGDQGSGGKPGEESENGIRRLKFEV